MDIPYSEIFSARPALHSYAAQVIEACLIREATDAVHPSSGLHATLLTKNSKHKAEWVDAGATTVPEVALILKTKQLLTWHYLTKIAA